MYGPEALCLPGPKMALGKRRTSRRPSGLRSIHPFSKSNPKNQIENFSMLPLIAEEFQIFRQGLLCDMDIVEFQEGRANRHLWTSDVGRYQQGLISFDMKCEIFEYRNLYRI